MRRQLVEKPETRGLSWIKKYNEGELNIYSDMLKKMISSKNAEVYRRVVAKDFSCSPTGTRDEYSEFSDEPETEKSLDSEGNEIVAEDMEEEHEMTAEELAIQEEIQKAMSSIDSPGLQNMLSDSKSKLMSKTMTHISPELTMEDMENMTKSEIDRYNENRAREIAEYEAS